MVCRLLEGERSVSGPFPRSRPENFTMLKKIVPFVLASVAVVVFAAPQAASADEPSDWSLENCIDSKGKPTTKPDGGSRCDLKNQKSGQCLVFTKHVGQADWDFAACGSRSATLSTKAPGAVSCGETFALELGNEYFRKCVNPQSVGINICSEAKSAPEPMHYDWQLQGCSGQVEAGKPVSLYNVSRKDSVVFAKRPSKVADTCWANKMKLGQCTTARDE
jgi:hypothetical protein